jgi:hypothetical protein
MLFHGPGLLPIKTHLRTNKQYVQASHRELYNQPQGLALDSMDNANFHHIHQGVNFACLTDVPSHDQEPALQETWVEIHYCIQVSVLDGPLSYSDLSLLHCCLSPG